jgi:hypothetical protein
VKQRAQVQSEKGSLEIVREIGASEGLAGFYVGSYSMLLREIPYNSFQMAFYAAFKEVLFSSNSNVLGAAVSGSNQAAVLGLIASFLASVLTQPADVIKTRLMRDKKYHVEGATPTIYSEFVDILESEGPRGLYTGLQPRVLLCTVGGLVYFYIAEFVNDNFSFLGSH